MDDKSQGEVSFREMVAYLQQFIPGSCDFCGAKMWTIHTDPEENVTSVEANVSMKDHDGTNTVCIGGAAKVFQVQCRKCGQVKYFLASHVMEKIKASKAKEK